MSRLRPGTMLIVALLTGCPGPPGALDADVASSVDAGGDASAHDTGLDASVDAGLDASVDDAGLDASVDDVGIDAAPFDAGPTGLVLDMAPTNVDPCEGATGLVWNGEGWGLWWAQCFGPGHILELDEAGHPGASLAHPPLPPDVVAVGDVPVTPDSVTFANGAYAFGGRVWYGGETPSVGPYVATVDRTGATTPWVLVPDANGVTLSGWDGTPGWSSYEHGASVGTRFVRRDAAMVEVSHSTLASTTSVGLARGHTGELVWGTGSGMLFLAPNGTSTPAAFGSGHPFREGVAWNDVFLVSADSAIGMLYLVVYDPAAGARIVAEVPQRGGFIPSLVAIPEQNRVALCWQETTLLPDGLYGIAAYVQLVDLDTRALLGAPTRVATTHTVAGGRPICGWGGTHLVFTWANGAGTVVASYRLLP